MVVGSGGDGRRVARGGRGGSLPAARAGGGEHGGVAGGWRGRGRKRTRQAGTGRWLVAGAGTPVGEAAWGQARVVPVATGGAVKIQGLVTELATAGAAVSAGSAPWRRSACVLGRSRGHSVGDGAAWLATVVVAVATGRRGQGRGVAGLATGAAAGVAESPVCAQWVCAPREWWYRLATMAAAAVILAAAGQRTHNLRRQAPGLRCEQGRGWVGRQAGAHLC